MDRNCILKELRFKASLSSGKGGQHVNKVNTKMEVRFHIDSSDCLTDQEKETIKCILSNRINQEGYLILSSQSERSQLLNKERVTERLFTSIEKALKKEKKRIPTSPTIAAGKQRLDDKKRLSVKKTRRKKTDLPE